MSLPGFVPHSPTAKQLAFLLVPRLEAFYGGAAGGGKSDAVLMAALQHVELPDYRALLLRRTYAALAKSGSLMDRAHAWLDKTPAIWREQEHAWHFPSGAKVEFGHCENTGSERQYLSTEFHFIGIDELSEWEEDQYRFLFSRVRRLKDYTIPLRMRGASNPGGIGHEWVRSRFIADANKTPDRATIRASLEDNPHLDRESYVKALMHLDPVTRERMLHGDWSITPEGAIFRREWLRFGEAAPETAIRIRFWDMAATAGGGCRTAGILMAKDFEGKYVIEHVVLGQWAPGERDRVILTTANADGPRVVIGWEEEGGSAGKSVTEGMVRMLRMFRLADWKTSRGGQHPTGKKYVRWGPLASQMQAGNVRLVAGQWNTAFIDELCAATEEEVGFLDQPDAAAGAYLYLAGKLTSGWSLDYSRPNRRDQYPELYEDDDEADDPVLRQIRRREAFKRSLRLPAPDGWGRPPFN